MRVGDGPWAHADPPEWAEEQGQGAAGAGEEEGEGAAAAGEGAAAAGGSGAGGQSAAAGAAAAAPAAASRAPRARGAAERSSAQAAAPAPADPESEWCFCLLYKAGHPVCCFTGCISWLLGTWWGCCAAFCGTSSHAFSLCPAVAMNPCPSFFHHGTRNLHTSSTLFCLCHFELPRFRQCCRAAAGALEQHHHRCS